MTSPDVSHPNFGRFDFIHLSNYVYSHNISSLKRVEFIHNRKPNDLKREYLASGIDPDKVIFNFFIVYSI